MNLRDLLFFFGAPIVGALFGLPGGIIGMISGAVAGWVIFMSCALSVGLFSEKMRRMQKRVRVAGRGPKNRWLFIPWWTAKFVWIVIVCFVPLVIVILLTVLAFGLIAVVCS